LIKVQLHPALSPQPGTGLRLRVDPSDCQILAG